MNEAVAKNLPHGASPQILKSLQVKDFCTCDDILVT